MKKTYNINLGGYAFTIDEDAYEALQQYLGALNRHFINSPSREDIVGDIETRLAELLQNRLSEGKTIISLRDVSEVCEIMGTPADFGADEEATAASAGTGTSPFSNNSNGSSFGNKRFYRNPDDKILGGVCSGLAAYFGVKEPLWIRLGLGAAAFFFGIGVFVYFVLWIITPEANTPAEKLEMMGEPVTFDSIAKKIETDTKRTFGNPNTQNRLTSFTRDVTNNLLPILKVIIKIGFIFFAGSLVFALGFAWISGVIAVSLRFPAFEEYIFTSSGMAWAFIGGCVLLLGLPILGLILGILRVLGKYKSNRWANGVIALLWVLGFVLVMFSGVKLVRQFDDKSFSLRQIDLTSAQSDTLNVAVSDEDSYDDDWNFIHTGNLRFRESGAFFDGDNDITLETTDSSKFYAEVIVSSRGYSHNDATDNAAAVKYDVSVVGNTLKLPNHLEIPRGTKWRAQDVTVKIYVPTGKSIKLNERATWHLRSKNIISGYVHEYEDIHKHAIKMTRDGWRCAECPKADERDRDDFDEPRGPEEH